jgi:hypothetical protein
LHHELQDRRHKEGKRESKNTVNGRVTMKFLDDVHVNRRIEEGQIGPDVERPTGQRPPTKPERDHHQGQGQN